MPMATSPADRAKLAAILGMMGSDHDGEALNAARLAVRMLRSLKMTWDELLSPPPQIIVVETPPQPQPQPKPSPNAKLWQVQARVVLEDYNFVLNEWETTFLTSISTRLNPLTPKQKAALDRILDKVDQYEEQEDV